MEHFEYDIDPACAAKRLDVFLTEVQSDISRSYIQKLIDSGRVVVNGSVSKSNYKVKTGDRVELTVPDPEPLDVRPEAIPLDIVYEDASLIVVNKPPGMVVHPAPGHSTGTLVNALLHHCRDLTGIGGVARPGIVHRLDKDTSGLVLVAKTAAALENLSAQFKERQVKKVYLALVKGRVEPASGWIDAPIGRHRVHRKKMALNEGGREAQTYYAVEKQFREYALVRVEPKTGRTHQIRVHLASIGCPILGDRLYGHLRGASVPRLERQALHAYRLEVTHPESGERVQWEAPLPEDLTRVLIV
ncbi:RluA family pseudouridine synthase [Nitrospina gracilis]|uniref:RluA family pseudouridine synthase n=1 Tax=Nitrospina gracilis TaxID=35801 RepID=UPI001F3B022C|nr:23S rRNA pseudouridine1911/1915/1917 synthase [Nitrospina gracilis Nb-211]